MATITMFFSIITITETTFSLCILIFMFSTNTLNFLLLRLTPISIFNKNWVFSYFVSNHESALLKNSGTIRQLEKKVAANLK